MSLAVGSTAIVTDDDSRTKITSCSFPPEPLRNVTEAGRAQRWYFRNKCQKEPTSLRHSYNRYKEFVTKKLLEWWKYWSLQHRDERVKRIRQFCRRRSANLLATDFFLNFSTSVFKMWVIQKPNKVALWNKWHFEEKKMEITQHV